MLGRQKQPIIMVLAVVIAVIFMMFASDRISGFVEKRPCLPAGRHLLRYPAPSPAQGRGEKSLLIRRDATLRILGALHLGIFDQPQKNEFFNGP